MNNTEILIVIIFTAFLILSLVFTTKYGIKRFIKDTYVSPEDGRKYHLEDYILSRNPTTGEWYQAVRYYGLESQRYYVREYDDFFNTFTPLNEWKNGTGQS